LIVFDCDGVLVDSEIISANVLVEYLGSLDIHIEYDYVQSQYLGRSFSYVVEDVTDKYNVSLPDNLEEIYQQKLQHAFNNELKPIQGIADILSHLSVDYCLASSSSLKRIKNSLDITSLTQWFRDRIFSAEQVENGKPAPDLFLLAADVMAYSPDNCLVIEDSLSGVQAAKTAGMEVIRFIGGSHLKHKKTQILSDKNMNIPVIDEWPAFFKRWPELKKNEFSGRG